MQWIAGGSHAVQRNGHNPISRIGGWNCDKDFRMPEPV
jgi:hypothetical protein